MKMDNQDKIFDQIKSAAQNAESKEFPALESVWSRVEDKLDNKALSAQNKKWKQWAVAASVVAAISVGYQIFKPEAPAKPETPYEVVTGRDPLPEIKPQNPVVASPDTSSVLRKDAPQILHTQMEAQTVASRSEETAISPVHSMNTVARKNALPAASAMSEIEINADAATATRESDDDAADDFARRSRVRGIMAKGRVFDAKIVTSEEADKKTASAQTDKSRQKPLLIVDGEPLLAKTQKEYDRKLEEVMASVPSARDTVFYLKEPLYIIDGTEYSEESLFGPNPTSPYAPLNLQEEGMKTRIYTGKDAVKRFGEKGKNGVVVVTTKNGKPKQK